MNTIDSLSLGVPAIYARLRWFNYTNHKLAMDFTEHTNVFYYIPKPTEHT